MLSESAHFQSIPHLPQSFFPQTFLGCCSHEPLIPTPPLLSLFRVSCSKSSTPEFIFRVPTVGMTSSQWTPIGATSQRHAQTMSLSNMSRSQCPLLECDDRARSLNVQGLLNSPRMRPHPHAAFSPQSNPRKSWLFISVSCVSYRLVMVSYRVPLDRHPLRLIS